MKVAKYIALLGLVSLLSLGAFAKDKNEGKFTLQTPVQVGSTQLSAGNYKASWDGTGDVQVKILQGKNVVATVPAKLVDKTAIQDSVIVSNANSSRNLEEIDFGGLKKALVFNSAETAQK